MNRLRRLFRAVRPRRLGALVLLGLASVASPAWAAIEFGTLRLYLPPGEPPYAEITLTDANPIDPADIRARVATPDAYSVANMRYVPGLQNIVLTPQAGPNGQVVLRLDRLPASREVTELDLLLLVGDRMSLSLGEYRVNLRGGAREFAAAPPGSRLGGEPVTTLPPVAAATPSAITSTPPTSVDMPATPKPAAAEGEVALSEVEAALQAWAEAWSARDVDAYLAAYTPDYAGRGRNSTREAWIAQRRSRILARQKISVEIGTPRLTVRDNNTVVVTFNQTYRSDGLNERSRKRMVMVRLDSRWLIQEEEEL